MHTCMRPWPGPHKPLPLGLWAPLLGRGTLPGSAWGALAGRADPLHDPAVLFGLLGCRPQKPLQAAVP